MQCHQILCYKTTLGCRLCRCSHFCSCICHLSTHKDRQNKWFDTLSRTTDGSLDFSALSIILNFSSTDGNSSYTEQGMEEKSCDHRIILLFSVNQLINLPIIHPTTHLPNHCLPHSKKICNQSLQNKLHSP